jgi:hypothetical protein
MRAVEPPVLPVLAKKDTKRETKETTRHNALLCQTQNLVSTPTLMREKQAAVTALMGLANPTAMKLKAIKMKTTKTSQLKSVTTDLVKGKPNKSRQKRNLPTKNKRQPIPDHKDITPKPDHKVTTPKQVGMTGTVHVSGCRHGDLNAMKSMAKAEALHYIRPNKFLADKGCLDCKKKVVDMKPAASNQRNVLYYCDQGIKGYDAPDDDDMKAELDCSLVLCAQCEAVRRIAFDKSSEGRRRKRGRI